MLHNPRMPGLTGYAAGVFGLSLAIALRKRGEYLVQLDERQVSREYPAEQPS